MVYPVCVVVSSRRSYSARLSRERVVIPFRAPVVVRIVIWICLIVRSDVCTVRAMMKGCDPRVNKARQIVAGSAGDFADSLAVFARLLK